MMSAANLVSALALISLIVGAPTSAPAFDCAEKKCAQITLCAEARHKLEICGQTKRDADNDGIPCENVCGSDLAIYKGRSDAQAAEAANKSNIVTADDPGLLISPASAAEAQPNAAVGFKCEGKRSCKQMLSCSDAKFYLISCGVKSLDGDRDGLPCNSLCR